MNRLYIFVHASYKAPLGSSVLMYGKEMLDVCNHIYVLKFVGFEWTVSLRTRTFPKLLAESWKHTILLNLFLCGSIKVSPHWNYETNLF